MPLLRRNRRMMGYSHAHHGVPAPSGFTPTSTESGNFLARTSGLNDTDKGNYDTLITGLVTDSVFATLESLWILAAPDSTNMLLNLCSSSYGLTQVGSGTFTASQGWAGNGSTGYFTTGLIPSAAAQGGTWGSTQLGFYIRNNRTTNAALAPAGGDNASNPRFYFSPLASGQFQFSLHGNNSVFPVPTNSAGTAQGAWTVTRVGSSSNVNIYRNGSSTALISTVNNPGSTVTSTAMFVGAYNINGTPGNFSTDQIAAVWYGSGVSGANAALIQNRINNFMTAYGTSVY
jgi:hypothetical protein